MRVDRFLGLAPQATRLRLSEAVSLQHEMDAHGIERKHDPAFLGLLQDACVEQRMDVAVHRLNVAFDPAGRLAQGQGTCPRQSREQLPPLLRQHLEQQRRRLETDEGPLRPPLEGAQHTSAGFLAR